MAHVFVCHFYTRQPDFDTGRIRKNMMQNDTMLGVLLGVIRWNSAPPGECADCGRHAKRRAALYVLIDSPSAQTLRLHLIAPGTRAESAAVDDYLRSQMQRQLDGRATLWPVQRICHDCARRRCEHFLERVGSINGDLAATIEQQRHTVWSALFYVTQPGYDATYQQGMITGLGGAPPAPHELLPLALWLWRDRWRARSA
jgi:hypothetical protein